MCCDSNDKDFSRMTTDRQYRRMHIRRMEVAMFWFLNIAVPTALVYFVFFADYSRFDGVVWGMYIFGAIFALIITPLLANQPPFSIIPYVARMWWVGAKYTVRCG